LLRQLPALLSLLAVATAACSAGDAASGPSDDADTAIDAAGLVDADDTADGSGTPGLDAEDEPDSPDGDVRTDTEPDAADASDEPDSSDTGTDSAPDTETDEGDAVDTGEETDTEPADTGGETDAEPGDAGAAEPGFGEISGSCGVLDDELTSAEPSVFTNVIDFADDPWDDPADLGRLTTGGRRIMETDNAGGSSRESEAFAFEVLTRCEGAELVKTETEVRYVAPDALTDILVAIDGTKFGVSVTRAVGFPRDAPYTVATASSLLTRKLGDILVSTANVVPEDRWQKQLLVVVAYGQQHVESMLTAYASIDAAVKADTIVWIVRTDGSDEFLY
jgi:hypothetical protein